MRILLTGFTPFNGETLNPSWLVAQQVAKQQASILGDVNVIPLEIPTVFHDGAQMIIDKLTTVQPDCVISLGQYGGSACVNVEYVALNCRASSIADNNGYQPHYEPIDAQAPTAYLSTLPVVTMVEAIQQEGIPAQVSLSAGTYVCNDVFYSVRNYCEQHQLPIISGFIHIPYLPQQVAHKPTVSSMALADSVRAMIIALRVVANTNRVITAD